MSGDLGVMSETEYFKGTEEFDHAAKLRIGVLLVNLGTPEAPTKQALRPYLKQFLSDPRVIELPRLKWWFVLNGLVLNTRPKRSAEAYKEVWTEEGSPLLFISRRQEVALRNALSERFGDQVVLELGMRYGNPSIGTALERLRSKGIDRLLLLPLYSQYSGAATASSFDAVVDELKTWRWVPSLRTVMQFHDHPGFIKVLANSVRAAWEKEERKQLLVMSFHGIPQRYVRNGDPYHCHCFKTARLLAEDLGLAESEYLLTFQSLFGKEEWLQPYTNVTLKSLPGTGVKSVDIICPGFTTDCLETLEEIAQENRGYFIDAGGESYRYIPALNDSPEFIEVLTDIAIENLGGWLLSKEEWESTAKNSEGNRSEELHRCLRDKTPNVECLLANSG